MTNEFQEEIHNSEGVEKKIICPTYDGLVRTLAGEMEIDQSKLYGEPKAGFDHEDINSWIGLVDFKDGKTPDVLANISSEQGKRVVKIDVQQQKPLESINEKASNSDLIYTMALTEAKMKVVAEAAEETYPAVSFQINDLRKDWVKMREEVLSDKVEPVSLNMMMDRMVSRRVMTTATLLIIGAMILSACGTSVKGNETVIPGVGTKPAITETVPAASETAVSPETAESEMVERINAYLKGEGEYSDAELADIIFLCNISGSKEDLGIIAYAPEKMAYAQGINLGAYVDGEKIVIMFGTKSENGGRIVLPVYYNLSDFKLLPFHMNQLDTKVYSWAEHDRSLDFVIDNKESLVAEFNKRLGDPFLITLIFANQEGSAKDFIKANGLSESEAEKEIKRIENIRIMSLKWLEIIAKNYDGWDVSDQYSGKAEDFSIPVYSSLINKLTIPTEEEMLNITSIVSRLEK